MINILAQAVQSETFQIVERIDPDFLGAIAMVTTIMTFVLSIITVVTVCRTYQKVSLAKMQNQMINELLAKGYTVDEIQQLASGKKRGVFTRLFDGRRQTYVSANPRPSAPVKPVA